MQRRSIEERLAQLEAQKKTLQMRLNKQERTSDTRRKILLGSFLLHRLQEEPHGDFVRRLGAWLRQDLPEFLTRDADRTLFSDLIHSRPGDSNPVPHQEPDT